jgi:hypothetical protein
VPALRLIQRSPVNVGLRRRHKPARVADLIDGAWSSPHSNFVANPRHANDDTPSAWMVIE